MVIPVTDLSHPGLQPYASPTEAQLRNRLEPELGIFIAESPKVIRIALDAGYEPVSLLTEEKHIAGQAADIVARLASLPVYTGSRDLLASLTGYELTRGVLCAMRRPLLPTVEQICSGKRRIVLVDNVVNSTNTGAILRAAAALGIEGILFTPTCCDPLNRRSVRVSMVTVFQIPWTYFDGGIDFLHRNGYKVAALALVDDSIAINDPRLMAEEKLVIVLGTEGDGLSRHIIDQCDYRVIIPMSNHVDSLNVAGAASVAFWQLCQR